MEYEEFIHVEKSDVQHKCLICEKITYFRLLIDKEELFSVKEINVCGTDCLNHLWSIRQLKNSNVNFEKLITNSVDCY
jgi:hypothetical protein